MLSVKRGEGTYVADEPPVPRKAERNEALRDAATRYASTAIAVGAELDDAIEELGTAYERVVREHSGPGLDDFHARTLILNVFLNLGQNALASVRHATAVSTTPTPTITSAAPDCTHATHRLWSHVSTI